MEPNTAQMLARIEKLESELQRVGSGSALAAIARNRVQQSSANGTVVAAAGAITLDAALTTIGPLGKVRVSANFSGAPAVGATCKPFLQMKIGAGAFVTEVAWAPETGVADDSMDCSAVFEFDSGAAPGTVITAHWQTTAGDGALTIGGAAAAAPLGAVLLLEELP